MSDSGPLSLVIRVAAILDEFDITYALGGSMASSFFGEPRATADIDVAVNLDAGSGDRLVDRLQSDPDIAVGWVGDRWFDATSAPPPGTMTVAYATSVQSEEHLTGERYRDVVRCR